MCLNVKDINKYTSKYYSTRYFFDLILPIRFERDTSALSLVADAIQD